MTPLLKVSKVLHNKPLLLIRNRPVARLPHQVQHTFTIFILAAVLLRQMAMKVTLRDEVRLARPLPRLEIAGLSTVLKTLQLS